MAWLAGILGPLLARELLRLSRGAILRFAMIAAPTFVLLSLLDEKQPADAQISIAQRSASASRVANKAFILSGFVIAFALPMWICPTIVRHRKTGDLDLLLTTQVSTREILLGMAGAAGAVSACIVASLAPVIAMMALFGGVDSADILSAVVVLLIEVLCMTGASLYAGVEQPTAIRAMSVALLFGGFAFGVLATIAGNIVSYAAHGGYSIGTLFAATIFIGTAAHLFRFALDQAASRLKINDDPLPTRAKASATSEETQERVDVSRSAMWAPLKLRLDDSSPTRLQIRAVWALYFLVGMPFCWLIRTGDGFGVGRLLVFFWIIVQPFIVVAAATNPLLGRRPGFFDDLLATNISEREIVNGVLWIIQPALIRLLAVPVGLSVIWFALNPIAIGVGLLIGTAWSLEVVLVGAIVSLVNHRPVHRMLNAVAFAMATGLGPTIAAGYVLLEVESLYYACPAFALVAIVLRNRRGGFAVLGFCLALHATAVALAGSIAIYFLKTPPENAFQLVSPLWWATYVLWEADIEQVSRSAPLVGLPFALALWAVVIRLWTWTASRFDLLVGRTCRLSERPKRRARMTIARSPA